MFTLCRALWADETGFIVTSELVLISTVGIIGLTAGLACLRDSVVGELNDVADAVGSLNQSYCYTGFSAASQRCCKSRTFGSCFTDHEEATYTSRVDIEAGPVVTPTPAPQSRIIEQERVIEERVIESEVIEQSITPTTPIEPTICPDVVEPVAPAVEQAPCETSGVVTPAVTTPLATTCDPCSEPRAQHTIVDQCGDLLHYSATRGQAVRLIDEVDAIHRPQVSPRITLW